MLRTLNLSCLCFHFYCFYWKSEDADHLAFGVFPSTGWEVDRISLKSSKHVSIFQVLSSDMDVLFPQSCVCVFFSGCFCVFLSQTRSGRDVLSLCRPRWRGVALRWGRGGEGTSEPFLILAGVFVSAAFHSLPRILCAGREKQATVFHDQSAHAWCQAVKGLIKFHLILVWNKTNWPEIRSGESVSTR